MDFVNVFDLFAKIRQYGLEYTHRRYYAKYKGKVIQNFDDEERGRIKVAVADVGRITIDATNQKAKAETLELYAMPSSEFAGDNYGMYFPPEPGDQVWVWFEYGDPTQPHYSGSWWRNTPGTAPLSGLPVEFNSTTNTHLNPQVSPGPTKPFSPTDPAITTRGIKTKRGHGLIFEDDALLSLGSTAHGRETRVELWTGQPAPAPPVSAVPQPPKPAIKRHRFVMSDALANITISSCGATPGANLGHSTIWDDRPLTQGVRTLTTYKHTINCDDVAKSITVSTPLKYSYVASDLLQSITISTPGLMSMTFNDQVGFIEIATKEAQFITLDDDLLELTIETPGSYFNISGPLNTTTCAGATFIQTGTTMSLSAGGLLTIQAQGISITSNGPAVCSTVSGGAVNNTFVGLVSETLQGGFKQDVTGPWQVSADVAGLLAPDVVLGLEGTPKFFLVTEAFFDIFNTHTHAASAGLGPPDPEFLIVPPTSPTQPIPDPAVSPNQDQRLFLTQNVEAS